MTTKTHGGQQTVEAPVVLCAVDDAWTPAILWSMDRPRCLHFRLTWRVWRWPVVLFNRIRHRSLYRTWRKAVTNR